MTSIDDVDVDLSSEDKEKVKDCIERIKI